jgi:membrane protein
MKTPLKSLWARWRTSGIGRWLAYRGRLVWIIVSTTGRRFGEEYGGQAAAALAYYALFSVFPLLTFLIVVGRTFLDSQAVRDQLYDALSQAIPVSRDLLIGNLEQALEYRGGVGVFAGIGLLWSAMGFFVVLARNVSRAWPGTDLRGFWRGRLVGLIMVAVLVGLLIAAVMFSSLIGIVETLPVLSPEQVIGLAPLIQSLISQVAPILLGFGIYLVLYHEVPRVPVPWKGALWAAGVAAILLRSATRLFTWYVSSDLVNYQLVYGSLGSLVALMFWIYLVGMITLLGAHLAAAIGRVSRLLDVVSPCEASDSG